MSLGQFLTDICDLGQVFGKQIVHKKKDLEDDLGCGIGRGYGFHVRFGMCDGDLRLKGVILRVSLLFGWRTDAVTLQQDCENQPFFQRIWFGNRLVHCG